MSIKSLHHRFPWLPPLVVVTMALAALVVSERRRTIPVSTPDVANAGGNDVTAALFEVLRTQPITNEVFTCPTVQPTKWDFVGGANTALNWSNWNSSSGVQRNRSYEYENPYAQRANSGATTPTPR
jgi:hypothetical protein